MTTAPVLDRNVARATVGALLVLAALAWFVTIRSSVGVAGMAMGIAQIGRSMALDMGAVIFLAMWLTMMVAMMFPTIGPMVLAHRMVVAHRGEGIGATVAFVAGFLMVWTAVGMIPLSVLFAFRNVAASGQTPHAVAVGAGIALILCGLYQFTPWKTLCLHKCRTPLGFIMTHDFNSGARGAFTVGLAHGAYCLGCCWALMTVLAIVGLMNLVWMAAITLVFYAEKNWRYGERLHLVVGSAVAILGIVVVLHPQFLAALDWGIYGHHAKTGM